MLTFKDYTMDQFQLPLSFEDFIPENHMVRVVNTIVDSLELSPLYNRYKQGGISLFGIMTRSWMKKSKTTSRRLTGSLRKKTISIWKKI